MFMLKSVLAVLLLAAASASEPNPEPVALGDYVAGICSTALSCAGDYVILAKSGISTVPQSVITGDIAVSPIAAAAMTGFSLTADATNEFSKSTQITGKMFAATYAPPIPAYLTTAVSAMEAAYTAAAGRVNPVAARVNFGTGNLGVGGFFGGAEAPLTRGIYTWTTDVTIGSEIVFQGTGTDTDVFILQITGNVLAVPNVNIKLTNGALAKNIFWQIAGHVEAGEGAHLEGIFLVKTAVLFKTASSLNGRVLTQTACDLQMATIVQP